MIDKVYDRDFKDFHSLIEIAVNLDKAMDENNRFSTWKTKSKVNNWHRNIKRWLNANYKENGIDKRMEAIVLD